MISEKEYLRRYAIIREYMRKDGMDRLLVCGLAADFHRGNIRYITGSGRGGQCIFPLEEKPVLLTGINQSTSPKLAKNVGAYELLDFVESDKPGETINRELSRFDRGGKIGLIGMDCLTPSAYLQIKEKYGDRLLDLPEYLRPMREIKSAEEIEMTRAAAAIADKVYFRLREIITPGLGEYEIYGDVKKVIYANGCEYSFDLIDAAGCTMNMSFHPTPDKLEKDGTLFMEISPAYDGYYAQLPVTLPVTSFPPQIKEMFMAWAEADKEVRPLLRPGTRISDIYRVLIDSIERRGFVAPLRPGHSLGLDILDFWSIDETNTATLRPDMVIAVHPPCMTKLWGDAVGEGYTYVITEEGCEKLSKVDLACELG
ncbi:MAG: aminopeptidase P family protein [Thermoleophilia bacterium]|nr:aminopeptidase P family protein [Thermoleophilia bacterium]